RTRLARGLAELMRRQPVAPLPAALEEWLGIHERRDGLRTPKLRGSIKQAAASLGLPAPTIQHLAARCKIARAAKPRRCWTFNLEKLRHLVRQKERETWQHANLQPDASGGAKFFGAGLRYADENSDGRFTQVTRRLRGRNTRPRGSD